ncbi:MAG: stage III sporulation protein AE [Defluviitaleaceae bacterium]|nr:stage III sporulation protein AE [Defluviitaleaceae bacterium]
MKIVLVLALFIGLLCIAPSEYIFAGQPGSQADALSRDMIERNLGFMDFSELDDALAQAGVGGFSLGETVRRVISGEADISPQGAFRLAVSMFFREISAFSGIMRNILVMAVLSAILKNLTDSFKTAEVGDLGFVVVFALMVVLIFQAFYIGVSAATSMISSLTGIMTASIPVLIALMVFSGNVAAPFVISPTLAFYAHITATVINYVITPLIIVGVVMTIVNCLSERDILKNFAKLIMTTCAWGLGIIAFSFGLVLSLQKIASPIAAHLVGRTARTAVEAVPIVGGVISGAADMVAVWAQAARSGVLVALIIMVGIVCFATVIKLVALVFIFKLTAALIAPICDKRLVECINTVGSFTLLLLGGVATVVCMFMLMAIILLSF